MSVEVYTGTTSEASMWVATAPRLCPTPGQTLVFICNPHAVFLIEVIARSSSDYFNVGDYDYEE